MGDGKSMFRGGYGLYYDQPLVGIFEQNAFTNPPYVNTVTVQNASALESVGRHRAAARPGCAA